MHTNVPKGDMIPQTVEDLQKVMAADAVVMMEMQREIMRLRVKVNNLEQKLAKARRKKHE